MAKTRKTEGNIKVSQFLIDAFNEVGIDLLTILKEPLLPSEVDIKPQTESGDKAMYAAYIDNRAAVSIKDRTFGIGGWGCCQPIIIETKKGIAFIAGWFIRHPKTGEQIAGPYYDGADDSDMEPIKGGISNAYKRTMPHFFPACAELYNYPEILCDKIMQMDYKTKTEVAKAPPKYEIEPILNKIVELFNAGTIKPKQPVLVKNRGKRDWILVEYYYRKEGNVIYDPNAKNDKKTEPKPETPPKQEQKKPDEPKPDPLMAAIDKLNGKSIALEWEAANPNQPGEKRTIKGTAIKMTKDILDAHIVQLKNESIRLFRNFVTVKGSVELVFVHSKNDKGDDLLLVTSEGSGSYGILEKFKYYKCEGKLIS